MSLLRDRFRASPVYARVVPFVIFVALTVCQGLFGPAGSYWFYLIKSLVGAWLIWEMRPFVSEMRWSVSWEAVVVGVAVCVMWVAIDDFYPKFSKPDAAWNPHAQFATNPALAWVFILARLLGSSLVVPPLEEVFYRSFLYRYFVRIDFQSMSFRQFHGLSFVVTAVIFGAGHFQWLAGILCGLAYQWLVLRKGRLGDAIFAHALTNFLLGVWVVWKGAWNFW